MGNYIFSTRTLVDLLKANAKDPHSQGGITHALNCSTSALRRDSSTTVSYGW